METETTTPQTDEASNVTTTLGSYSVSFTRPLAPEDTTDKNLTRDMQTIFWMYGRVDNNTLFIVRSADQFGTAQIDLRDTTVVPPSEGEVVPPSEGEGGPAPVQPTPSDPVDLGSLSFVT